MKKILSFSLLLTALGVMSSVALGDTLCAQSAAGGTTLSQGVNIGLAGTCNVAGITFTNFNVYGASIGTPVNSFVASVSVSSGLPNTLVFNYNTLPANDDIQFSFQANNVPLLNLGLGGGSAATVSELVCSTPISTGETCTNGGATLGYGNTTTGQTVNFLVSVSSSGTSYFLKDINGGSGVQQTFNVIPEPMTMSLMGAGLLGLGLLSRRRKK